MYLKIKLLFNVSYQKKTCSLDPSIPGVILLEKKVYNISGKKTLMISENILR